MKSPNLWNDHQWNHPMELTIYNHRELVFGPYIYSSTTRRGSQTWSIVGWVSPCFTPWIPLYAPFSNFTLRSKKRRTQLVGLVSQGLDWILCSISPGLNWTWSCNIHFWGYELLPSRKKKQGMSPLICHIWSYILFRIDDGFFRSILIDGSFSQTD